MTSKDKTQLGNGIAYSGARPLKVITDSQGNQWLCDAHIDDNTDPKAQGCWRLDEMPFDRNY